MQIEAKLSTLLGGETGVLNKRDGEGVAFLFINFMSGGVIKVGEVYQDLSKWGQGR